MDSEGWIEVSMIASFNRIKSLTPDVAIVREVMEMSILLEVKEDMVRLAGDEGMRWVLPDAPPCKFSGGSPGRNLSPRKLAGEGAELSHGVPDTATASALGIEDLLHAVPMPKFDVENALMRNTRDGSANMSTSSTASVLASDEGKTMTPETSIAGDSKSDFDVDEDIKIEQH
jgi:la-related protein 1